MVPWNAAIMAVLLVAAGNGPSSPSAATAPAATTQPAAGARAFTGSAGCRDCHETFYEKWATSFHGLAMQPFTPELARTSLSPQKEPIQIGPARYRADIEGGRHAVLEEGPGGARAYPIAHVMGGKNVYYFLTPLDRGRLQVLPVAYDVRRTEWYDTTASAVRHFGDRRDEALDWRERPLTFNTSCYGCHVSQLATNYDLKADSYHTVWSEPGINCETCHGPGAEHVRVFREAAPGQTLDDLRLISMRRLTIGQVNTTCAPCHAKMVVMTTDFTPGDRYFDHYDLITLEHDDFYPDGRDLGENYTHTTWSMSPCVRSGQLSCMHCHTSSGRYRFAGEQTNHACLPCHRERVENAADHTHHPPGTAGSRCVACHMPMTEFARMRRSDHSMRPPMPAATLAFKSPNACNLCHTDRDAAWADPLVRQWRQRDYQAPAIARAHLIAAARRDDWSRLDDMLTAITGAPRDEIVANSLVRLLRNCEDARKWPALLAALKDPSPLIRSSAAESLSSHLTAESVPALLEAARDDYRLVRVRAAAALAALPPETLAERDRRALEKATAEFQKVMMARPDDHASHYNLGNFHMNRREYDRAVACFETSLKLQPDSIPPAVNLSLACNALGQNDRAEQSLRRVLKADPANAAANLNLGLLLAEMNRLGEAESALRAAFKADPRSAVAAYNLAVLTASSDRLDEAIEWCRKATSLRPEEPRYAYTYAFYLRQNGRIDPAVEVLTALTRRAVPYADAYALLGQIHEELGRTDEAVATYRQATRLPDLPEAVRYTFEMRIQRLQAR